MKVPDWILYATAAAAAYYVAKQYFASDPRFIRVQGPGAGMVWSELDQAYVRRDLAGQVTERYA